MPEMADIRAHPDYAEGYETAFRCDPPRADASPEYRAGYEHDD